MQYLIREFKELWHAWLAILAFYLNPAWLTHTITNHNAIEHAMGVVKKSIATMVLLITVLSLFFVSFEFVQEHEKPAEIFAVLLVHGAITSVILAGLFWLWLRDHHQVGVLVGWFMLAYWVPLWLWNMVFEIHVGFSGGQSTNLFLLLAHQQSLSDWDWLELAPVWSKKPEFVRGDRREVITRPPSRISVNDAHALHTLTRAAAGLAIVPEFLVEPDVASGALHYVLPEWSVNAVGVYAVWPSNAPKDGLVRHFIGFVADQSGDQRSA